jgi:uncharacterized protein YgbK (DUF1537 family)
MAEALRLSFYGDDFTGSTDAMEALASHGVPTVLFTRRPTPDEFRRFDGHGAVGLAGSSRSQTPDWMDRELRADFQWLKKLGAGLCHYKVCSTFDSSPATGSIGKAIDVGREVFAQEVVPLVVGCPQLKRYTAFGHLFAAYQGIVYRIDRHPVMSHHPVTPMDEADLAVHLARQTTTPVVLASLDVLARTDVAPLIDALVARSPAILLIDVADPATQLLAGQQVMRLARSHGPFVVGSSGVEYALLKSWASAGIIAGTAPFPPLQAVSRLAAVSGSCSPTTAQQIRHASANGFDAIPVDPLRLAQGDQTVIGLAVTDGLARLGRGRSVIIHSALGAENDRSAELASLPDGRHRLGRALGRIAGALIERAGLTRAVIAGGDTSSHALGELDIFALTTRLPLAATPGSPLCLAHSSSASFDGLEIALKGGQIGGDDYFSVLRDGP